MVALAKIKAPVPLTHRRSHWCSFTPRRHESAVAKGATVKNDDTWVTAKPAPSMPCRAAAGLTALRDGQVDLLSGLNFEITDVEEAADALAASWGFHRPSDR